MTARRHSGPIAEQLTTMGDTLFRWRSYAPLILLPLFCLAVLDNRPPTTFRFELMCLLVSLSGLLLRAYIVATAPEGASTRGTTQPTAVSLSSEGAYSVVRHPLYLANTIIAVGCAMLSGTWYLPVIVMLISFIYHERIAAREELFLQQQFGERFVAWSRDVPAMLPSFARFRPSRVPFQIQRALMQESHALCAIGAAFLVLTTLEHSIRLHSLEVDRRWLLMFALTLIPFLTMVFAKTSARRYAKV